MVMDSSFIDLNIWDTAFCRTDEAGDTPSIINRGRIQPMVVTIDNMSEAFSDRRI